MTEFQKDIRAIYNDILEERNIPKKTKNRPLIGHYTKHTTDDKRASAASLEYRRITGYKGRINRKEMGPEEYKKYRKFVLSFRMN